MPRGVGPDAGRGKLAGSADADLRTWACWLVNSGLSGCYAMPCAACGACEVTSSCWHRVPVQEWQLVQQLRDEIEMEAGPLQPEFGTCSHLLWVQSALRQLVLTLAHGCDSFRRRMLACLKYGDSWHANLAHAPWPRSQTTLRCAASCAPASTTSSRPRRCSWSSSNGARQRTPIQVRQCSATIGGLVPVTCCCDGKACACSAGSGRQMPLWCGNLPACWPNPCSSH